MKEDLIKEHYKEKAEEWGTSPGWDLIVREKETELISDTIHICTDHSKVLDLGCGNGYTLEILDNEYFEKPPFRLNEYYGIDFSEELLDIAKKRKLANCTFLEGDARNLKFDNDFFDMVYTQRCLINILNWEEQKKKALNEIYRVLKPDGYYLMIEGFTDGLENNNKAREECGLPPLEPAQHNLYLDKEPFFAFMEGKFVEQGPCQNNFLSSHYFIARVLHALVTKGEQIKNTEFVKFFSYLPPIGNYSPIQAYLFKKV